MYYKEDWEATRQRFMAWWNQEIVDRVMIQAYAPKSKLARWPQNSSDSWWCSFKTVKEWANSGFDMEYLVSKMEKRISNIYFGGDAIPRFFVNLGPGSIAGYLGCQTNFTNNTITFGPPIINDWDNFGKMRFDPGNKFWQTTKQLTELASKKGANRFLVTFADLAGPTDLIPWLRGTENFCVDLIENAEELKKLRNYITKVWIKCYDDLFNIIQRGQEGTVGTMSVWSPGKTFFLQCDFSSLFSPSMYEKFVVPEVQSLAQHLDNPIYHLDGPGAVKHLDTILEVPEIDAIQWVPGEGNPPAICSIPMLKKIQKKKKSLFVYAEDAQQVEDLISELDPRGLLISINCGSEEEARTTVKKAKESTMRRMREIG